MNHLVLDIETKDDYISFLGQGWIFKYHNLPESGTRYVLLGVAFRDPNGNYGYTSDLEYIQELIDSSDCIVGHNLTYDIGGLMAYGIRVKDKPLYDTMIMAKLYDNTLFSYSLDNLSNRYLSSKKFNSTLTDAVYKLDLYPYFQYEINQKKRCEKKGEKFVRERPDESKLAKWSKQNMDVIQQAHFKTVAKYAIQDIRLTWDLFCFYSQFIDMQLASKFSFLTHICIDYRIRGIRVDLDRARDNRQRLLKTIKDLYDKVFKLAGKEFDLFSGPQVAEVLDSLNISYAYTSKGNPSVTKEFLEESPYEVCQAISDARKAVKVDRDFIQKLLEMQYYTTHDRGEGQYGRVFPELKVLSAKTGRFSCTNPNFQQQPARHPIFGEMVRSMFVPEEGHKWYSIDYKSQELLVGMHYAKRLDCEGADQAVKEFCEDTSIDLHQRTADLVGCTRTQAKTIGLGIFYGLGVRKLAGQLGITEKESKKILRKFNKQVPYFKALADKCQAVINHRGSIRTLSGRHCLIESNDEQHYDFSYKATNLLIQGSCADMMAEVMLQAYQSDIDVLFTIHDEVVISCATKEEAEKLRGIMENVYNLEVPIIAEMGEGGSNFYEGGH